MHPASQAPAEVEGRRTEPETRRQARVNKAKWEAGHRATIQGEVSFPGGVEWREDFPRLEDRAIVNRTNQFLRHEDEEGASGDRFVTIVPLEHLPAHAHKDCQVIMIGCSSAALHELKSDPLLQNEIEIRPENNPSPATFPNIDTNEGEGSRPPGEALPEAPTPAAATPTPSPPRAATMTAAAKRKAAKALAAK